MLNPYSSKPAKIVKITPQTDNINLFHFEFLQKVWGDNFSFQPGQFIELSIPDFGEAPFAPCNSPGAKYLELCIRDSGKLTHKLHSMQIGDRVGIRGPYGNGWPIGVLPLGRNLSPTKVGAPNKSKNLLIVIGGLGLIPLRTLILGKDKFLGKDAKIQIFYGARAPKEMLFRYEYSQWRENEVEIRLTVDKECPDWVGCTGLVTTLFDKYEIESDSQAFLCGPPIMYKFVLEKLKAKGIMDKDIYVSLERRMHCGLGVCQHCAVGPYYTCKDGPVFQYAQIKDIPGAI